MQVNGKVRDRLQVAAGLAGGGADRAREGASEKVQAHLNGRRARKTIVVPDKLVNFVVG